MPGRVSDHVVETSRPPTPGQRVQVCVEPPGCLDSGLRVAEADHAHTSFPDDHGEQLALVDQDRHEGLRALAESRSYISHARLGVRLAKAVHLPASLPDAPLQLGPAGNADGIAVALELSSADDI